MSLSPQASAAPEQGYNFAYLDEQTNHARLLNIAEQAVGAHEIIRGNVMQLEFMRDEQLDLPVLNSPAGYQGLAFCRVG